MGTVTHRLSTYLVSAVLALLISLEPGDARAQGRGPALDSLINAAASEKELHILSAWPETRTWREWESAFNARYGLNIRIRHTTGLLFTQVMNRLAEEIKAGRPATTDVYAGAEPHIPQLAAMGALETANWRELNPAIPHQAVAPGNAGVAIATRIPGVAYNTKLVPPDQVPRTLEDVLHPRWKKKIASTPSGVGFIYAAAIVGEEQITKFLTQLSREQLAGLIACGDEERVSIGEFAMLVLNCGQADVEVERRKGAPIAHAVLTDVPMLGYNYLAVPKNSQHPNLAKLFAQFSVTEEAQRILFRTSGYDLHWVPGTASSKLIDDLRARGITPRSFDAAEAAQLERTSAPAWRRTFLGILRGGGR